MTPKLSTKVTDFIRRAEETGELRALLQRAESRRDERRRELATELATLTPAVRERATKGAVEVRRKAASALAAAEAALRVAKDADRAAGEALRGAELTFDSHQARLRFDLWGIVPDILKDHRAAIEQLREEVRIAARFWVADNTPFAEHPYGSNLPEVKAAGQTLLELQDRVTAIAYTAVDFGTIEAECGAALAEARAIAEPFLEASKLREVINRFIGDEPRAAAA